MLLPAKQQSSNEDDEICNVISGGPGHSSLDIRVRRDMVPLLAQPDEENGALNNFTALLVCPMLSCRLLGTFQSTLTVYYLVLKSYSLLNTSLCLDLTSCKCQSKVCSGWCK